MDKCPITGGVCHCEPKLTLSPLGAALLLDLKATLRKIISDQTWYLSFLICESVPILRSSHGVVLNRLLWTTKELRELLEPITGKAVIEPLTHHLSEYLRLINAFLKSVRDTDSERTVIIKITENRYQTGLHLGKLNNNKLSPDHALNLMKTYDDLIRELISRRSNGDYELYNSSLDRLTKHGLIIADAIYESLTP